LIDVMGAKRQYRRKTRRFHILAEKEFTQAAHPCPYHALNALCEELYGMTIEQVIDEKRRNTKWYKDHKDDRWFEGCDTKHFTSVFQTYSALSGLPKWLLFTFHKSMRAGGLGAALSNIEANRTQMGPLMQQFAWTAKMRLTKTTGRTYGGQAAVLGTTYANQAVTKGSRNIQRNAFMLAPSQKKGERGVLSAHVGELKRDDKLAEVSDWVYDPTKQAPNEYDYQLVKKVLAASRKDFSGEACTQSAARIADEGQDAVIAYAVRALDVRVGAAEHTRLFTRAQLALLTAIRGMPRDEMRDYLEVNLVPFAKERANTTRIFFRTKYFEREKGGKEFDFEAAKVTLAKVDGMTRPELLALLKKIPGSGTVTMLELAAACHGLTDQDDIEAFLEYCQTHKTLRTGKSEFRKTTIDLLSKADGAAYTRAMATLNVKGTSRDWSPAAEAEITNWIVEAEKNGTMRLPKFIIRHLLPACTETRRDGRTYESVADKIKNLVRKSLRFELSEARSKMAEGASDGSGMSSEEDDGRPATARGLRARLLLQQSAVRRSSSSKKKEEEEEEEEEDVRNRGGVNARHKQKSSSTSARGSRGNANDDDADDTANTSKRGRTRSREDNRRRRKVGVGTSPKHKSRQKDDADDEKEERKTKKKKKKKRRDRYNDDDDDDDDDDADDDDADDDDADAGPGTSRRQQGPQQKRQQQGVGGRGGGAAGNGGPGGPAPLYFVLPPNGLQAYTGGHDYDPQLPYTYVRDHNGNIIANRLHGLRQAAHLGRGQPVDPLNNTFSCGGHFVPAWVVPLAADPAAGDKHNGVFRVLAGSRLIRTQCYCCSFPIKVNDLVYAILPRGLLCVHYPCFRALTCNYVHSRMQASLCRQIPAALFWAISANMTHPPRNANPATWRYTWTYIEAVDFWVALKLSGALPAVLNNGPINLIPNVDYATVLQYGAILQCCGKTPQQLAVAWPQQRQHIRRLMTPAFLAAHIPAGLPTFM
jgi:hypothetical protein